MAHVRNEIYDDNGLIRVEYIEIDDIPIQDLITQKQAQLLQIYTEIQTLQSGSL